LDAGANVLFLDSARNSALHYASRCDSIEIVKLIVDKAGMVVDFVIYDT
jgi:ankyrin repeat protein